jgi:hypothetical protein
MCLHKVGEVEGCVADRVDLLEVANPAYGRRITAERMKDFRDEMPAAEFIREFLGWWDEPGVADAAIGRELWLSRTDRASKPMDPVAFAIDVPPDRSSASIGVGGRRDDGRSHVGVVDSRPGVGWVVARMVELRDRWSPCAVVVDGRSAAASLIPALTEAGFEVEVATAADMARACGAIFDAVTEDTVRHLGKAGLTAAVAATSTRPLGEGFAWDRRDPRRDISQWVAVTLALHGYAVHGPKSEVEPWGVFV